MEPTGSSTPSSPLSESCTAGFSALLNTSHAHNQAFTWRLKAFV